MPSYTWRESYCIWRRMGPGARVIESSWDGVGENRCRRRRCGRFSAIQTKCGDGCHRYFTSAPHANQRLRSFNRLVRFPAAVVPAESTSSKALLNRIAQLGGAVKRRACPSPSSDSLPLPTMPSPSSMLYYVFHPNQLRSIIQWYDPTWSSRTYAQISNTVTGRSGTTPYTSATKPRKRPT
jgi:hypothetical protein